MTVLERTRRAGPEARNVCFWKRNKVTALLQGSGLPMYARTVLDGPSHSAEAFSVAFSAATASDTSRTQLAATVSPPIANSDRQ